MSDYKGGKEVEAGLNLDILVAQKVMGWKLGGPFDSHMKDETGMTVERFHFSSDMGAAWKAVERFKRDHLGPAGEFKLFWDYDNWYCHIAFDVVPGGRECERKLTGDPSAPLVICHAMLLALGALTSEQVDS